jgi:hypothetical protein
MNRPTSRTSRNAKRCVTDLASCFKLRPSLALLFVANLLVGPLAQLGLVVKPVQAQVVECSSETLTDRVFQQCKLGNRAVEKLLETQALNDVMGFHKLPSGDRARVMTDGRDQWRALVFLRLLELINKPNKTAEEQQALAGLAARIKLKRVEAVTSAKEFYNFWKANPCEWAIDAGTLGSGQFEYDPGFTCHGNLIGQALFGSPLAPAFSEFIHLGGLKAYAGDLGSESAAEVGGNAAGQLIAYGGLITAGTAVPEAFIFTELLPKTAFKGTFPHRFRAPKFVATEVTSAGNQLRKNERFARKGIEATTKAANTTKVTSALKTPLRFGTLSSGPALIVTTAISVAVERGLAVFESSQVEGKLDQAIADAQSASIDLVQLTKNEQGMQEFYGAFLATTLPEPDEHAPVPPPSPSDRKFILRSILPEGPTTEVSTISYASRFDDKCHTARLSGGWLIDKPADGVERWKLALNAAGLLGEDAVFARSGGKFFTSNGEAFDGAVGARAKQEVDEFEFLDCGIQRKGARIKFEELTTTGDPDVVVTCPSFSPELGEGRVLGSVYAPADAPQALTVKVNGAAEATVNGITVRNLGVDNQYRITSNILALGPPPLQADFTLTVIDSTGQESSSPFGVRKTAILNPLVDYISPVATVGTAYSEPLRVGVLSLNNCSARSTFSITEGSLPPGISIATEDFATFTLASIAGTPTTGGLYTFTVTETLANGEKQSGSYMIFVKNPIAEMPDGAVAWWRGDNNAEDFFNNFNGARVGSASFDVGLTNDAFSFDGTDGYIKLPGTTFNPSNAYTFETWYQTKKPGVILGVQHGAIPYQANVAHGPTAPIYVGTDGKLHVRLFGFDGEPAILSPTRVDDGKFHHVAIAYNRIQALEEVYFDGQKIGTLTDIPNHFDPSAFIQFGTGYVSNSQLNMFGWFNFTGLIDEPALYNRGLTANEIKSIYDSGGGGKILLKTVAVPPSVRDGNDGGISVHARGGAGGLLYSKDDGVTFQDFPNFYDLSPGTYQVVVKDIFDRTLRKTVVVQNPDAVISVTSSRNIGTCYESGGTITIHATGLTGPGALYSVNGAGINAQSSNVFPTLPNGTYTPWVKDITGVEATGAPITLTSPPPLGVHPGPGGLPDLPVGVPFSQKFTTFGGVGTRTMTPQSMPPWATVQANSDGSMTVSGTPTQAGNFTIFFKVGDVNGCNADIVIPVAVIDSCPAMAISPTPLPIGKVGQEYPAFAIAPANAPAPFQFTVIGLPPGMSATTVGEEVTIGGTPTQSGTFPIRVTAISAANCTRSRDYTLTVNLAQEPARPILISEVRTSGPNGPDDEFIELYNNTDAPIDLRGYTVTKKPTSCISLPAIVAAFEQGTMIPARGHYLITGSNYSLGAYASSNASLRTPLDDDANVAVFFQAVSDSQYNPERRMDAVGFGDNIGNYCDLIREGNNLPAFAGSNSQYSYVRKMVSGRPQDTGDNLADFILVSTDAGSFSGAQSLLGAPGPENSTSPIELNNQFAVNLLDQTVLGSAAPNRIRDFTSNPANNSAFGTMTIRRRVVNNSGKAVTSLRFRIIDLTTYPVTASGVADLRAMTSLDAVGITVNDPAQCSPNPAPCSVTVKGTALNATPSQSLGGGWNSSLGVGSITLGTPLAPGATVNVQFLLGVQQAGSFRFFINLEALTSAAPSQPVKGRKAGIRVTLVDP